MKVNFFFCPGGAWVWVEVEVKGGRERMSGDEEEGGKAWREDGVAVDVVVIVIVSGYGVLCVVVGDVVGIRAG